MAVSTTSLWETITALLTLFNADTTLSSNKVLVLDGPVLLNAAPANTLFVGATPPDDNGFSVAGDVQQVWGELGARAKYEEVSVHCELWVRDGSTDLSARRATAQTLMAAIETALRLNFTLSITRVYSAQVSAMEMHQAQTQTGSTVNVRFTIAVKARLASQ